MRSINLPTFTISGQSVSDGLAYTNTNSTSRMTFAPQFMYELITVPAQRGSSRMVAAFTNPPARIGVSFEIDGRISKENIFDTSPLDRSSPTTPFFDVSAG